MTLTRRFMHQPVYVDAVQVTETNIAEVAKWCDGQLKEDKNGAFIKVAVTRPQLDRQTKAYVGDWVLKGGMGLKVYNEKAFKKMFIEIVPDEALKVI